MTTGNVVVVDHPLARHHLAALRDRDTTPAEFRRLAERLTFFLVASATRDLPLRAVAVQTPLAEAEAARLAPRVGLVPILRAGLGMVRPALDLLPEAEVWHLGFYRDEKTLRPVEYYKKLPPGAPVDVALVLDPMLATGGSAVAAIEALAAWGVPEIRLLAMIAAPEGMAMVTGRCPGARIHVCAVDARLNDKGFIVPGLGDAGDRTFNARAV
jgi:uracil phosphoribosyltransferase